MAATVRARTVASARLAEGWLAGHRLILGLGLLGAIWAPTPALGDGAHPAAISVNLVSTAVVLELGEVVQRAGIRLLLAGDAVAPRTALHAFCEGDNVGRAA